MCSSVFKHKSVEKQFIYKFLYNYQTKVLHYFFKNMSTYYEEFNSIKKYESFLIEHEHCFERINLFGHVTASALILNPNFDKVLLTYHAKLKKWLQLGGHADGNPHPEEVALQEAKEESGLNHFYFPNFLDIKTPVSKKEDIMLLDIDIHEIPAYKNEASHFHFDLRFLLIAQEENIQISKESLDLKWISLKDVNLYTQEQSTLRQIKKVEILLKLSTQA